MRWMRRGDGHSFYRNDTRIRSSADHRGFQEDERIHQVEALSMNNYNGLTDGKFGSQRQPVRLGKTVTIDEVGLALSVQHNRIGCQPL